MAAPAQASRIRALENAGLRFDWIDDLTVFVEGQYRFNVAGSSWVHVRDPDAHGYLVATLVTDFRRRQLASKVPAGTELLVIDTFNSEKPAAISKSISIPELTNQENAEIVAGPDIAEPFVETHASRSLLPVVWA